MKWMSRMCVYRMIYILVSKDTSGTTIWFLDWKRLEKISPVRAYVGNICIFQQRRGVLSVLLHNRLVPRTSSMQSQFTLNFLTASNYLKEVISLLNSLNGCGVVVFSIKGDLTRWLDRNSNGGAVCAILVGCDIFWIHYTARTGTNIFSLHVFNYVGPFVTKSASS